MSMYSTMDMSIRLGKMYGKKIQSVLSTEKDSWETSDLTPEFWRMLALFAGLEDVEDRNCSHNWRTSDLIPEFWRMLALFAGLEYVL